MANAALLATLGDQTSSQAAGSISSLMPSGVILPFGGNTPPNGWLLCDGSTISRTVYADLFQAIGTAHGRGDGSTTFNLPDFRGRFMRGVDGTANRDPDKTTRTAANPGGNTGNNVGSIQNNATAKNGLSASASGSSVSGTTNIGHSHGSSSVSGSTNIGHSHSGTSISGYVPGLLRRTMAYGYTPVGTTVNRWVDDYNSGDTASTLSGSAGGQSLGTSNVALASGSAGGQTLATSNVALASGSASAQTITVADGDNETRPLNINVQYIIKV